MIPIGPLMHEHRLIEKMIDLLKAETDLIKLGEDPDIELIERAVDFFRNYADRCHHGKEEDILFRELKKKDLSPKHKAFMDELIDDHVYGRELVTDLHRAKEDFLYGNEKAAQDIRDLLLKLIAFYPDHITREDKQFFYPCMEYFSKEEKEAMLDEFWDFDRKMIHEKYSKEVDAISERKKEEKIPV